MPQKPFGDRFTLHKRHLMDLALVGSDTPVEALVYADADLGVTLAGMPVPKFSTPDCVDHENILADDSTDTYAFLLDLDDDGDDVDQVATRWARGVRR